MYERSEKTNTYSLEMRFVYNFEMSESDILFIEVHFNDSTAYQSKDMVGGHPDNRVDNENLVNFGREGEGDNWQGFNHTFIRKSITVNPLSINLRISHTIDSVTLNLLSSQYISA